MTTEEHELLDALLRTPGMTERAAALSRMMLDRDRAQPITDAREFELDWLVKHVKDATGVRADDHPSGAGEPQRFVAEKTVPGHYTHGGLIVVPGCPRLAALVAGQLPSLEAFRKGRTP